MYDLIAQTAERAGVLEEHWAADEDRPLELQDGDVRPVPRGFAESAGRFLYWLMRPNTEPEDWTVILNEGRGRHPDNLAHVSTDRLLDAFTNIALSEADGLDCCRRPGLAIDHIPRYATAPPPPVSNLSEPCRPDVSR